MTQKREKFRELAEGRTTKALDAIARIGNLSNRQVYEYEDAEVKKIMRALRDAVAEVEARCPGRFSLVTPREHARRGSQVCLTPSAALPAGSAYAIVQALIARGVVGDFRAGDGQQPDILRFGFTPLYLSYQNVLQAAIHLREVLSNQEYSRPEFNRRHAVT